MGKFPAYGMVGIGIAAAIGFVFALTLLSNNPAINPEPTEQAQDSATSIQMRESESGGNESAAKLADDQAQSAQLMMQQDTAPPTLVSITALDAQTNEVIGEVVPEMQFAVNEPVLIQANFVSQNAVASHLITLAIRNDAGNSQNYEAANFRGNIGADSNIMLELYWNPPSVGRYTLLLLSANADEPAQPIAEIPITVVEVVQ